MEKYIVKGGQKLKLGYTTGSCATAAATAAAEMLLMRQELEQVLITLPQGERVVFTLENVCMEPHRVSCSVIKDAGDDPDVTDGLAIVATCELIEKESVLIGGEGIGVVCVDGLSVPRGEAAINKVPRQMILANLKAVSDRYGYTGGFLVTIAAPGGEAIAKKTFNPRLGITGGISILGTTGIVEPMSEQAIVDTIKLLIDKRKRLDSDTVLITPGNYGRSFISGHLGIATDLSVKYGNFLGECLDYLVYKKFKRVLLVGHFGKLVKVAGGIMQTHSSMADCRMEIITAHAACAGAGKELVQNLMQCPTTDAALALLEGEGLADFVYASLLERMRFHLRERVKDGVLVEIIVFSQEDILMQSDGAETLIRYFHKEGA